ncbi:MAG: transaldolase [Nitrospiraceae bacterium]|nr:MAG: transaldolase [Nitrospiraceae bacterium]
MGKTKMEELAEFGQSIWLDSISRSMIETGYLQKMIDAGLRGMTSNPTIFDKAISAGKDYDRSVRDLHNRGKSTFDIYDDLTVRDVQDAADLFRPVYKKTGGLDGYVSLEINPKLAFQTAETIEEGKRLHQKVNFPNVMFKVPATDAGFPAIEELLSQGINVNTTLIFSLEQYEKTARAFLRGLRRHLDSGGDISRIASVASVFVSRIDTAVDRAIDEKGSEETRDDMKKNLASLRGRAAVANSRLIFQKYQELFEGSEFSGLRDRGAKVQRVLWGSTGTKDPAYSDIKYVTELIGRPTVNTLPEATLDAFMDHGVIEDTLTQGVAESREVLASLAEQGIYINQVCARLLDEGVVTFEKSFDSLLNTIEKKKA